MPTVKDKVTGKVISEHPYTPEGKEQAEEISNKELNWEVSDAPGRTESYALGGMVPGQPGFGVRPMNRGMGGNAPSDTIIQDDRIPNPSDFLEKGGKVKK